MKPPLMCFVCGSKDVVVLKPIPLCAYHDCPPEIPVGIQDSDEELVFAEDEEDGYNNSYTPLGDFPIPVYPI